MTSIADIRWDDDDELLAFLDEALRTEGDVPPDFVAAGKAAFTWRSIDAELAALVYDSEREPALTRTQTADLRALTFASAGLRTLATSMQLRPESALDLAPWAAAMLGINLEHYWLDHRIWRTPRPAVAAQPA